MRFGFGCWALVARGVGLLMGSEGDVRKREGTYGEVCVGIVRGTSDVGGEAIAEGTHLSLVGGHIVEFWMRKSCSVIVFGKSRASR